MFCEASVEKFAYADRTEVHSNCGLSDIDVLCILYHRQLDVFHKPHNVVPEPSMQLNRKSDGHGIFEVGTNGCG